jgi:hypothetical protein
MPPARSRIRFAVYFGLGVAETDLASTDGVAANSVGANPSVALGIRHAIHPRVELQSRVSAAYTPLERARCYTCEFHSGSMVFLGVDGGVRVRPVSATSSWYVGLGPRLELAWVSGSATRYVSDGGNAWAEDFDFSFVKPILLGALETGFILGDDEQWDLAVRGALGSDMEALDPGEKPSDRVDVLLGYAF